MMIIGVIGAGEVGSQIARAATAAGAAEAGDFVVVAVPLNAASAVQGKRVDDPKLNAEDRF